MKHTHRIRYFCWFLVLIFSYSALAQTSGFTVPAGHPRLWWNTARLNLAKTWYATHPFTPRSDDPFGNAFRYALTGETSYARTAINWLVAFRLPAGQVLPTAIGCDECRWSGETAMLVFDWCYDQMTPSERTSVINLYNTYWSNVNQQDWGGIGMEGNNYYWGNVRNSLEWGIASFGGNTQAQSFLDHALITRWQNSFVPYAATGSAAGGALDEGPGYGCTMLDYPNIPFITVEGLGRGILHESGFFPEALVNLLYSTTPAPVINGTSRYYDFFPYNEVELDDIIHNREYFGNFMVTMANHWESIPLGQYARRWVNLCAPTVATYVQSINQAGREKSFSSLPLDYYAPGLGYFYGRTSWDTTAMAFMVQMKWPEAAGHAHTDWGNFQLFRKGRWLTRESSGYSVNITGVEGGQASVTDGDAHNTIFIGPTGSIGTLITRGMIGFQHQQSMAVKRVESRPSYGYTAVDLTGTYKANDHLDLCNNPYVSRVVRECIFVRPLEALVVFDRILASSEKIPAANVVKTVLIHFETNPAIQDANHVLATIGNQCARLTTLAPSAPTYQVVNEGANGQYRLQIATSGVAQSYFINVLQGRDASGTNLTTNLVEDATSFRVTLTHPTLGTALIVLQKGDTSSGGSFGFAATGTPIVSPLLTRIQGISVNDSGPVWEDLSVGIESGERSAASGEQIQLEASPNPFNPSTVIAYRVTRTLRPGSGQAASRVNLAIYNPSGKLVATLVSGRIEPGKHQVVWNAAGQASGVYLVRLQANGTTVSRKILLLQ